LDINDFEENRSHLVKIHKASGRVFDILDQLWKIRGLIGAGAVHRMSLAAVVKNVVDMVGPVLPKGVKISQEYEPGADLLMGNSTLLNQAILNLVMNASQAMPARKGIIEISLHTDQLETGRNLVLCVKDNGTGMDSQILDNIFTPFFTTKPKGEGTGLGLSTTRNIVAAHNGDIRVTSEVGKGSLFQIFFPGLEGE
jgi:signal transduction histidine kinase